jgi:U3 small nucleolar RNA-associated protein 10
VVGVTVSLACAGGDELLWKNLNTSLLAAASSDTFSVKKAGLETLVGILESVGEEYLGLLPECLPVLSECLEERDAEIVALTKKILSLAEDLSGESLDEYL